ncbi:MAG: glycoside hydrolase family 28 protein [Firmicutes bacterium]|nr:glycoside hydrolase family 28 protein [Bacillota bacterium]
MSISVVYIGSSSACFELAGSNPYYAPEPFQVFLNEDLKFECDTNVFSLFDLKPQQRYLLKAVFSDRVEELEFETAYESCCLNVKDFGACGDGVHDDTSAIRMAVSYMPPKGRLLFPEGTYLTRPIVLKSHMTLDLQENATILGWRNREDYPICPGVLQDEFGREVYFGGFEGYAIPMYESLITGQYIEDVAIVGKGAVNGSGEEGGFWKGFREFPAARPRLMFFNRCKDVTLHGVLACNSPSWNLHPYYSENVRILDVKVQAPKVSPNTDAIDPESCDYVDIIGCRFSVGDDCIAIKSSKIELGQKLNKPADHHTIRNCLMEFGHGAVTLGSEIGAGVTNLSVSQCYFKKTDRGLRIKSRRGRGKNCYLNDVLFENIRMDGVLTPIAVNMWYNACDPDSESEYVWSRKALPVDERTPRMGSFCFRNLVCTDAEVAACYIDGLPESPIEKVVIEHVSISFAEDAKPGVPIMENFAKKRCRLGLYLDNVRHISVKDVSLQGVEGEALLTQHCETLETEDIRKG